MTWLLFALLTVVTWGVYGVLLHTGVVGMGDPANGRIKAFLFVGLAYFVTAVVGPLVLLATNGASWSFPARGVWWSLIAGIAGAVGALCVLLAFGSRGSPAVVMSIVFAGAPIVNAFTAIAMHPPAGGLSALRWQFVLGILLAAAGGYLVVSYKPGP
jgi:drug/metabolite transporter (DMT)-like permease